VVPLATIDALCRTDGQERKNLHDAQLMGARMDAGFARRSFATRAALERRDVADGAKLRGRREEKTRRSAPDAGLGQPRAGGKPASGVDNPVAAAGSNGSDAFEQRGQRNLERVGDSGEVP
jgi:hypothetical protein